MIEKTYDVRFLFQTNNVIIMILFNDYAQIKNI